MENRQRLAAFSLGLAVMYFLDPDRGRRRRALVRDQLARSRRAWRTALSKVANDATQRAQGTAAALGSRFRSGAAPDEVITERVHTAMGRVVRHPGSIEVAVKDGYVTLSGPILEEEVEGALARARSIRGVTGVEDRLEKHEHAEHVSGLQGEPSPRFERFELMQENWAPTARAAMAAGGIGLALLGSRSGRLGLGVTPVGMAMAARAMTNVPLSRLVGLGPGAGVEVQKDIIIGVPADRAFDLMSHCENFPQFMTHVHKVTPSVEEGRSHWSVSGPAGLELNWDVQVTRQIEDRLLAWKTLPGSMVQHVGVVRFDPENDGRTRVDVKMAYKPPLGFIGHAMAAMLASDPKRLMDDDLARMKSWLETGRFPSDAAQPHHGRRHEPMAAVAIGEPVREPLAPERQTVAPAGPATA